MLKLSQSSTIESAGKQGHAVQPTLCIRGLKRFINKIWRSFNIMIRRGHKEVRFGCGSLMDRKPHHI